LYWGEYSDPRERKYQVAGGDCIIRDFIICMMYSSPGISTMRWTRHVECMGEMRNTYQISVIKKKPVRKKSLGRSRRRCRYNIKMGLNEVGCYAVDWVQLKQIESNGRYF
jgi:hypothetical protein